jgi:hypothetical protein
MTEATITCEGCITGSCSIHMSTPDTAQSLHPAIPTSLAQGGSIAIDSHGTVTHGRVADSGFHYAASSR